jgi:hypothetical protein
MVKTHTLRILLRTPVRIPLRILLSFCTEWIATHFLAIASTVVVLLLQCCSSLEHIASAVAEHRTSVNNSENSVEDGLSYLHGMNLTFWPSQQLLLRLLLALHYTQR